MNWITINSSASGEKNCHAVMITVCGMSEMPKILLFCVGERKSEDEINNLCLETCPDFARAIIKHKHECPCIGHIWLT